MQSIDHFSHPSPSSAPGGPSSSGPSPGGHPASDIPMGGEPGGQFPDDVDVGNVPPELKKEGSDWFAVFNPKVKRVLDVSLVHTLIHERCVLPIPCNFCSNFLNIRFTLFVPLLVWSAVFDFQPTGNSLQLAVTVPLKSMIQKLETKHGMSDPLLCPPPRRKKSPLQRPY
jgi:hypothetical protein